MAKLTLAAPVLGGVAGDEVDIPDEQAEWYVEQGYAYDPANKESKVTATSVEADKDPTLARNREDEHDVPAPDVTAPANEVTGSDQSQRASNKAQATDTEFDPAEHTVEEVNDYLASADDAEAERVLKAEKSGKDRSTVTG